MSSRVAARSSLLLKESLLKAGTSRGVLCGARTQREVGLRFASVHSSQGLHRNSSATVRDDVWRYPARSAGLAIALAGSVGLAVISTRLETTEDALPKSVGELGSARIQEVSGQIPTHNENDATGLLYGAFFSVRHFLRSHFYLVLYNTSIVSPYLRFDKWCCGFTSHVGPFCSRPGSP